MKVKGTKIFIASLGCSKNLVDAEVMVGLLQRKEATVIDDPAFAEIIVVNTCSFINDAKEESIGTILEMADYKNANCKKLVVTGCLSQRYSEELLKELPEVDLVVGTGEYHRIVELIEDYNSQKVVVGESKYIHTDSDPRVNSQESYTAWLKIAEGCDRRCSFCIIPSLRGDHRARDPESLIKEAKRLVSEGARELNLISQDLSQYGKGLIRLLQGLEAIDGLEWIRLLYFYPDDLEDDFIDFLSKSKKVCHYLDIPVQHFADSVLKRMNRKISGNEILEKIAKLRKEIPNIILRTSIIVGFPGESEEDFEALKKGIREARFDHLGVFRYSDEEDTPSFKMDGKVNQETIESRHREIYRIQESLVADNNKKKYIGKKIEVLIEGAHPETELLIVGRHSGQAPEIDGLVIINDASDRELKKGDLVIVEVSEVHQYDLIGSIVL